MKLINLKCENCGARLKRAASMRTLECEYCGSTFLGETTGQSSGLEDQTFILPVELEENAAISYLQRVIKSSPFVHEDAERIISQIKPRGVMVPCYSFECELTSNWMGENSVDKVRTVYNPVTGTYINEPYKEWYPQNGQHFGRHNAFVSASGALKESESWGLFPLPVEKKTFFSEGESGENQRFSLEVPNMFPDEAWTKKGEAVAKWMEQEACRTLVEKLKNVNSKIESKKNSLVYAPVWIFNYKVDNIPYRNIVCASTGKVVGEIPTNFDKLFEKLRNLKQQTDQKNMYVIIAGVASVILLFTGIFWIITAIIAYYIYQEVNKLRAEFDTYIANNKYNLCFYILRQNKEFKESLNTGSIQGLEMVEKCIDEEEGAKIDNMVAKQLVEKYLASTKPKFETKTGVEKAEKKPSTIQLEKLSLPKEKLEARLGAVVMGETSPEPVKVTSDFSKTTCTCGQNIKPGWKVCPICGNKL